MRFPSIDLIRTFAIFLMVLVHFSENLSGLVWAFAGFGAPHFALLTGVSYRIWLASQEKRGRTDEEISKVTTRRGLFLFGLGLLFNVFVWLPEGIFNWDVLTLIGTAILLLNWARRVPMAVVLVACLLMFALSPLLRYIADYPAFWTDGYFSGDLTVADTLIGFLATGYFPLFPWLLYPFVGFMLGSLIYCQPTPTLRPLQRLAAGGAILIVIASCCLASHSYLPLVVSANVLKGWTMFPPSYEYVVMTVGVGLVTLSLGHRWIDLNEKLATNPALLRFSTTFSRHSLSIYVLHHLVHLWPLWIYGSLYGEEPTAFWRIAMPGTISVPLAGVFLVFCYFFFRWMEKSGRTGIEGWMRWLCD